MNIGEKGTRRWTAGCVVRRVRSAHSHVSGRGGCASGPDPEVVRAQAAVQEARDDQAVAEYAPEALRDAEQALVQAEQGQRQGLDDEEVDHLAYVAEQKAAIAQSQAVEQRSQDELVSSSVPSGVQRDGGHAGRRAVRGQWRRASARRADGAASPRGLPEPQPRSETLIEGHTDTRVARTTTCRCRSCALSRSRAIWSAAACLPIASAPSARRDRPEAPNDSAKDRRQNRRVEIVILDAGKSFAGVAGG